MQSNGKKTTTTTGEAIVLVFSLPYPDMIKNPQKQIKFCYIYKVSKKSQKKFAELKNSCNFASETTKQHNIMKLFRTKKSQICETASRYYRNLWDNATAVEFERMDASDYIRMEGYINGVRYQVHINNKDVASRLCAQIRRVKKDNDNKIIKVFAVACACADYGQSYAKFAHLETALFNA